jgi:mannose-1-phosphate guanylyltransferase
VTEIADHLHSHRSQQTVLLAVGPTHPETDYGWIKRGPSQYACAQTAVCDTCGFVEKPRRDQAHVLLMEGWLWNTGILVSPATSLMQLLCASVPDLAACFAIVRRFIGTDWEHAVVAEAYRAILSLDFSMAVLAHQPQRLSVLGGSVATGEVPYGAFVLAVRRSAEMQDFISVARHGGCAARMSLT